MNFGPVSLNFLSVHACTTRLCNFFIYVKALDGMCNIYDEGFTATDNLNVEKFDQQPVF